VVGGHIDHVHILARQARTISLAEWVKELKRASNLWAKQHFNGWGEFLWQTGYGAFSVSQSMSSAVEDYVRQ
jgi:putative transposase